MGPVSYGGSPSGVVAWIAFHHNRFRCSRRTPESPEPGTVGLVVAEGRWWASLPSRQGISLITNLPRS
ncbi:hypothetical protein I552_8483 [Mycobacterium xenopi 3993]|nr:hypothetical protein I552_8483 [Mycobacterium xenopi 3993]